LPEGLHDGGGGLCPFTIIHWHGPYNWGKAQKTSVRVAGLCSNLMPQTPSGFHQATRKAFLSVALLDHTVTLAYEEENSF
jgi:hypothetical protein